MKIRALILSTALLVPMTLAGQGMNHDNSNQTSNLSSRDRMFLHSLASEDQSEIDLAKLALQKSTDPQIQQYAKTKILAADPSMKEQAMQIAQREHTPVSSSPNPTAKAEYDQLSKLSGKEFDRAYARYEGHQQAADLVVVKNEAADGIDAQVRDYARKETAPVEQASQAAQQLAHAMNVNPQP